MVAFAEKSISSAGEKTQGKWMNRLNMRNAFYGGFLLNHAKIFDFDGNKGLN